MDYRERIADEDEALRVAMQGMRAGLWTALPGTIESYDPDKKTAVIQPALQGVIQGQDGSAKAVNLPLLPDVPVVFPSGGGCSLTFPLAKGDDVLVVFSSRCIDGWWQSGGIQLPMEPRMHDLSDGFAIPGPKSQPRKGAPASTTAVQLRTDDGNAIIQLDPASHNVTVVSSGAVSVAAQGAVSISGGTSASVSATGTALLKATGAASVSSSSTANVSAPFVSLGFGSVGNLATLPTDAAALFSTVMSSGVGGILQNPVGATLGTLSSTLSGTSISSGLSSLVTAGTITSADATSITASLTGTGGLLSSVTALTGHTDLLAGVTIPTLGTVPNLNSVIGISSGLDNVAGGAFGSPSTILSGMTTGLSSLSQVTNASTYVNSIVSSLGAGTTSPAAVLSTLTSHINTLLGFVNADTSAFTAAQSQLNKSSSFLGLISNAQSPSAAVQSLMSKVTPSAALATLKTIGQ